MDATNPARWLAPNQQIWQGPKNYQAKYSPDQPRDEQGRWTGEAGDTSADSVQVAGTVIPVCIASGISRFTVGGIKSFSVTYDCASGQTFTISGPGHKYDGIIRDPFSR
jgi:hypothetical protein